MSTRAVLMLFFSMAIWRMMPAVVEKFFPDDEVHTKKQKATEEPSVFDTVDDADVHHL